MTRTGERIKARREALGVSAAEIAKALGVSRSTVYRYEKGEIEKVPAELLQIIAEYLNTTPASLLGLEDAGLTPVITRQQKLMTALMDKLNDLGQAEAVKQVENLTFNPRYQKGPEPQPTVARILAAAPDTVMAAHNDNPDPDQQALMLKDIENLLND